MKIQKTFLIVIVLISIPLFCGTSLYSPLAVAPYVQRVAKVGALLQAIQTADGNFVSLHRNRGNLLVRKIRVSGEKIWERILHIDFDFDTEDNSQSPKAIAQTSDGGYIIVGRVEGIVHDYYEDFRYAKGILIKLSSNGSIVWKKIYYESDLSSFYFTSVIPSSDGGFLTAGKGDGSGVHLKLVRFNSSGEVVWSKTLIGIVALKYQLLSNKDAGCTLVSQGMARGVVTIIRLDHSGKIIWKRSLEGEEFRFEVAATTTDQGLAIAGRRGNEGLSMVRLDKDGRIVWKKAYQLLIGTGWDLIQTADGKYVLIGSSGLLEIDSSGNFDFLTALKIGGSYPSKIFNSSGDEFLFLRGGSGMDLFISKTDSQGMVPGCNLFARGSSASIPFGESRIKQASAKAVSDSPSLKIQDINVTSVVSDLPISYVCQ